MKTRSTIVTLLAVGMIVALAGTVNAAAIVDWDFSGLDYTVLSNGNPAPVPILAASDANAAAGLTSSNLTHFGLQVSDGNVVAGEANLREWDVGGDGANDGYLEFTLTADVAGALSVDSISISEWRNGAGAPDGMAFDVSVDGGAFALYDAIQTDSNSGLPASFDTFTFTQVIAGADSIVIRFTSRAAPGGSTGNLHINGLTVNGFVPEPATMTLLALGGFGLLHRRRRS